MLPVPSCQCWSFPTDLRLLLELLVIVEIHPMESWYQMRCLRQVLVVEMLALQLAASRLAVGSANQGHRF